MIRFLLDTNILSEPCRPNPNQKVLSYLNQYRFEIGTGSVVLSEILYGCWRLPQSRKREVLSRYVEDSILSLPVFDYNLQAARWHARERVRLSQKGKTPAFIDGQIASTAAVNDLILVTRNIQDFLEFDNLTLENWFEP